MSKVMVPEGWEFRQLGDFTKEINEKNRSNSSIPVLSVTKYDGFVHSLEYFKKQVFSRDTSGYKKVAKGDFAYATIHLDEGSLGLLRNWDCGLISPMYTVFRVNNYLNPDFLFFLMKSDEYMRKYPALGQGSINRRLSISYSRLSQLDIHYPPLPEQQKIASILTSVDDTIEKTESQISKLQDLKKGMMQELLTKGIGHTEFKDSPVGRIPKEWDAMKLGELVSDLEGGVSVNGENQPKQSGEFGVLKVSSVRGGKFIPSENKRILESELQRAKIHPKANRILFSRANTPALVGESGYIENSRTDLFLPDKLWMLDIHDYEAVNIRWLSYVLAHGRTRKIISDVATGTSGSMKNISKQSLLAIYVAVPSKQEQDNIAASILSLDNTTSRRVKKRHQLENLKKALMQDLLTGKVRVKVN